MAASIEDPSSIDFNNKTFDEKKKIVVDIIFKMCNYTDLSALWIHNKICASLTGVKTGEEIFKIIFGCDM